MREGAAWTFLLAWSAVACSAPTSPSSCGDPQGRSPIARLELTCAPTGSSIGCRAIRRETGYCAGADRDVTATARWLTTNAAVGLFTSPGHFDVRGSGATVLYAETNTLESLQAYAYQVDPAGTPSQVGVVRVSVHRAPSGLLGGAGVTFEPRTGAAQQCESRIPPPNTPCWFWTDYSPAVVRASRAGFAPVERTVVPTPTSWGFFEVSLVLTAIE